ncbi:MAG: Ppx/GppA phosphatase family protein [Propionicimonas sp.]|uniref:Ppx/GppA phosphatase family protein n=1 Tax=Propionicimonas sp. TaxID=1955623 RepID=UPI003D14689F
MAELFAAVDCGTNSVRLLVSRREDGGLVELDRRLHLTRLGQGVDATGRFRPDALARTLDAMADFGAELDRLGVPAAHRRVVATSAARDAANSDEFFSGARLRLGVDAEVIPGEEEARLSFAGATSGLPGTAQPVLVMDIGGGSTELVLGSDGVPAHAVSLDVGAVRVRERFLPSDPPAPAEIGAARAHVDELLDGSGIAFDRVATWVGVGGTATSLSALALHLPAYDRARVHGSVLAHRDLDSLTAELLAMPVAEVAALPTMVPGRADVICAGALICAAVGDRVAADLVVSEADILDGIVLTLTA